MPQTPKEVWITLAVKSLMNAIDDHYSKSNSQLPREQYWKSHLKLTGLESVDSWVQKKVNSVVDPGIESVDAFVRRVKNEFGI